MTTETYHTERYRAETNRGETYRAETSPGADTDWMSRAACRELDLDGDVFFPEGDRRTVRKAISTARAICADCPVRTECLAWARQTQQAAGIWGGVLLGKH